MRAKKTVSIALAMVLVCALSVAGTLAYLTATTANVTNTFAAAGLVPDGAFQLKEHQAVADSNNPGVYTLGATEVESNTYSKVVPNVNVPKDPFVRLTELESPAYLYVKVEDTTSAGLTWAIDDAVFEPLTGHPGIYVLKAEGGKLAAFSGSTKTFNIMKNKIVNVASDYSGGTNEKLVFTAYLAQAGGFSTAVAAWNATFGA